MSILNAGQKAGFLDKRNKRPHISYSQSPRRPRKLLGGQTEVMPRPPLGLFAGIHLD